MSTKAGLWPIGRTALGKILTDWRGYGLLLLAPSSGKAAGRRYLPIQPGMALASDICNHPSNFLNAGAEYVFKDAFRGARFVCDGQYLRPLGGSAIAAQRAGSIAAPVYRLTLAAAAGSFVPPEIPLFPANLLIPGQSQIRVEMVIRHSTATVSSQINVRLGTAIGTSDNRIVTVPTNTTSGQDTRVDILVSLATATTANTTQTLAPGAQGNSISADITTQIDTTVPMAVTADISGSASGDVFDLLFYRVTLIQ